MTARARKRQPAPINPLDLDALKAAGLNAPEVSEEMLRQHAERERREIDLALRRNSKGTAR